MIRFPARLACLLLVAALGACDWMPGKPVKEDETPIPADVHSFNVLYRDSCSGCHGGRGKAVTSHRDSGAGRG